MSILCRIGNRVKGTGCILKEVGGQAVLGRQNILPTPWLTERHGYDPTWRLNLKKLTLYPSSFLTIKSTLGGNMGDVYFMPHRQSSEGHGLHSQGSRRFLLE